MTRLSTSILWLLLILVSVACADTAGNEQPGQGAPATSGAIIFTQQEDPSATSTPIATRRHGTPLAQRLDSTVTPVSTATDTASPTVTPSPPASTPVPLSSEAIAACPVSLPNLEESPNEYYIAHEELGLQCNDLLRAARSAPLSDATPMVTVAPAARPLALEPPASCPVTQPPEPAFDPPGRQIEPFEGKFWYGSDDLYLTLPFDGTWSQLALGEKVFWWSENYPGAHEEPEPAMAIRGRQLDAAGETFEQFGTTNASHASFPATAMLHGLTVPKPGCWEITGEYKGETLSFVVWVP